MFEFREWSQHKLLRKDPDDHDELYSDASITCDASVIYYMGDYDDLPVLLDDALVYVDSVMHLYETECYDGVMASFCAVFGSIGVVEHTCCSRAKQCQFRYDENIINLFDPGAVISFDCACIGLDFQWIIDNINTVVGGDPIISFEKCFGLAVLTTFFGLDATRQPILEWNRVDMDDELEAEPGEQGLMKITVIVRISAHMEPFSFDFGVDANENGCFIDLDDHVLTFDEELRCSATDQSYRVILDDMTSKGFLCVARLDRSCVMYATLGFCGSVGFDGHVETFMKQKLDVTMQTAEWNNTGCEINVFDASGFDFGMSHAATSCLHPTETINDTSPYLKGWLTWNWY